MRQACFIFVFFSHCNIDMAKNRTKNAKNVKISVTFVP